VQHIKLDLKDEEGMGDSKDPIPPLIGAKADFWETPPKVF